MGLDCDWIIRDARLHDAEDIAKIHVAAWQEAYRGIVADSALLELEPQKRAACWRERLAERAVGTFTLVAAPSSHADRAEKGITAFCSAGPSRDPDAHGKGEIYAIYALPSSWGRGAGYLLFREAIVRLQREGMSHTTLWVLERNARGRSFYERQKMMPDGARLEEEMLGTPVVELRYATSR